VGQIESGLTLVYYMLFLCHVSIFSVLTLEIDRYGFFEANTDISKIFKSCYLLHYQKYNVFYALHFFQKLKNQDL